MVNEISAFIPGTARPRVALLIDGDNISRQQIAPILREAACEGELLIRRVYGNAALATGWTCEPDVQMVHAGTGKNATDMLICVHAMDIMLSGQANVLVIASSDGDFFHLATGLREKGHRVVGLGLANAAPRFQASCSRFGILEGSGAEKPDKPRPAGKPTLEFMVAELIRTEGVAQSMPLQAFGSRMGAVNGVATSALQEKNWRAWFSRRADLFDVVAQDGGAIVRLKTPA